MFTPCFLLCRRTMSMCSTEILKDDASFPYFCSFYVLWKIRKEVRGKGFKFTNQSQSYETIMKSINADKKCSLISIENYSITPKRIVIVFTVWLVSFLLHSAVSKAIIRVQTTLPAITIGHRASRESQNSIIFPFSTLSFAFPFLARAINHAIWFRLLLCPRLH